MSTTLATLLPDVLGRIEENCGEEAGGPIFWSLAGEVYPAMVDAQFEAALITGTVQESSVLVTLAAYTTWFSILGDIGFGVGGFGSGAFGGATPGVPEGAIAAIRMKAPYPIRKTSLKSLDDMQPNWQQATPGNQIIAWGPLGLSGFFIYPQMANDIQVTMDFLISPVNKYRPYDGSEPVPLQVEFLDLVSQGAAAKLRSKEGGQEAEESEVVYQAFLSRLKALSLFQSRINSLTYTAAYGARQQVNPRTQV